MMSICFKEKIKITPDALTQLIVGCNQDIRQVLHHLTMIKAGASEGQEKMNENQAKIEANKAQKTSGLMLRLLTYFFTLDAWSLFRNSRFEFDENA